MERITVTIPKKTLDRIKRIVGPRGVSRFLADAAKTKLAREDLTAWFDEMEARHGKPSPKLVREIDRDMRKIFGNLPKRSR
jgi:hypothetical protein